MRFTAHPEPGFFKVRLCKAGPWVPARIRRLCSCTATGGDDGAEHEWRETCDRFPPLAADVDGEAVPIDRVWIYGHPIDERDWRYMTDYAAWARAHARHKPEANPRRPITASEQPVAI